MVRGRVVDATTGRPIRAFNVRIGLGARSRKPDEPTPRVTIYDTHPGFHFEADDGDFTVPVRTRGAPYAVAVHADGYARRRAGRVLARAPTWEGWPVVFRLDRGKTLDGAVVDATSGRGVARARALLVAWPGPLPDPLRLGDLWQPRWVRYWRLEAETERDGRFAIPHAPTDAYLALLVQAPGFAHHVVREPKPGQPLTVRLARGATIAGTAKDVPGLAIDKALVEAEGPGVVLEPLTVQPDGSFRIADLPAGEWRVTLSENRRSKRKAVLTVAAGQTARLDFARPPGRRLRGRVTRSGKPLAGAMVWVTSSVSVDWGGTATTDADGRYVVTGLPPGDHRVAASRGERGDPSRLIERKFVYMGDRDASLDFAFYSGRIKGRLLDGASGKPLTEAYVRALRREARDAPATSSTGLRGHLGPPYFGTSAVGATLRTLGLRATRNLGPAVHRRTGTLPTLAADGSFVIENLPPGEYLLYVSRRHHPAVNFVSGIRIARDGVTATVEARLKDDSGLRLKVVDADTRRPVTGARVGLCTNGGKHLFSDRRVRKPGVPAGRPYRRGDYTSEHMATDAAGGLSLDGLQQVAYGVWVVAAGYGARFVAPVPAAPTEPLPETVVALERAGVLVLRAEPATLVGLRFPYVTYRILDARGRAVHPGGEVTGPLAKETGVAKLFGKDPLEHRIDILAPGRYTVQWEIHHCPERKGHRGPYAVPAAHRGEAPADVRKGKETVIQLKASPRRATMTP